MFCQPANKLSISERVKQAAQERSSERRSSPARLLFCDALTHVLFTIDLSPKWRACSQANVSFSTNTTDKDSHKQRYLIHMSEW